MNAESTENVPVTSRKRKVLKVVGYVVLGLIGLAAFMAISTLTQYWKYERAACAPRLRSLVGKTVTIPARKIHVMGVDRAIPAETGTLEEVGYRFNDRPGFIDLKVRLTFRTNLLSGETQSGLSPEEAEAVIEEKP